MNDEKKKPTKKVVAFTLGLEELAMALGLINRPDLGREVMLSTYPDISHEEIDSRLISASHSLLARGLCTISRTGAPLLGEDLERVLFPLVRFDYLLQLSIVREQTSVNATVHTLQGKQFTSHTIYSGVLHVLEYGAYKQLMDYLQDVFEEFGENSIAEAKEMPITLGVIGQVLEKCADATLAKDLLVHAGWTKRHAANLVQDMANQVFRATILRIKATNETPLEELKKSPARSLLLLKGKRRSWLGKFPSTADSTQGTLRLVNRKNFTEALNQFVM